MVSGSEEPSGHRSRRQRRRDEAGRERAMLRDRRTNEPPSPVGVIVVIVLLAVLILGIGGGFPRLLGHASGDKEPVGVLTPGGQGTDLPQQTVGQPTETSSGPATSISTPPVQTARPGTTDIASAVSVARSWATRFYTRTPLTETYDQLVTRAAEFTTPELADSFSAAGDATYDALKADGGVSKVLSVAVAAPRPDTAPVDTPTRITKLVTVNIATTGKHASQFAVPLLVTVASDDNRWLVSSVDGGTGP